MTFFEGDIRAVLAGRKGGLTTGPTKSRDVHGERNPASKLSERQIRHAVEMVRRGYTQQAAGESVGACASTIGNYCRGRRFTHLGLARNQEERRTWTGR